MSSLTWIRGQKIGREITLVQNEFISDVTSFTTDVQTYLLQVFFFAGGETCNIAIQLVLQQYCKKKLHVFCRPFYRTY